jgi:hypothetical protein
VHLQGTEPGIGGSGKSLIQYPRHPGYLFGASWMAAFGFR